MMSSDSKDDEEEEDAFSGGDFEGASDEDPPVAPVAENTDDEDDFLGLCGVTGGAGEDMAEVEVLFEGVEMSFDEHVSKVTLAEVLLSQGKEEEADTLFKDVADNKGLTHWVAGRLDVVSVSARQTTEETALEEEMSGEE